VITKHTPVITKHTPVITKHTPVIDMRRGVIVKHSPVIGMRRGVIAAISTTGPIGFNPYKGLRLIGAINIGGK
jgi:hypothetical protein